MGVLTNICEGMLMVHSKPTLVKLKRYVDSGVETLLRQACEKYFTTVHPEWRDEVKPFLDKAKKNDKAICNVYVEYYRDVIQKKKPHAGLEGLMGTFSHDASHQQKMLASLVPVLTMLTSGTLGGLLSRIRTISMMSVLSPTLRASSRTAKSVTSAWTRYQTTWSAQQSAPCLFRT